MEVSKYWQVRDKDNSESSNKYNDISLTRYHGPSVEVPSGGSLRAAAVGLCVKFGTCFNIDGETEIN